MKKNVPQDMPCMFIDEHILDKSLGLLDCHFRAIYVDSNSGATEEQVKAAVAATEFESLTKDEIKFMLACQWSIRDFP
jgi:hypothetical protein